MLTFEELQKIPQGEVFAEGVIENSPEGLFMTNSNLGKELMWVAIKGHSPVTDWAVYTHWADQGRDFVINSGDKVAIKDYIQKLVPCETEVLNHYRY